MTNAVFLDRDGVINQPIIVDNKPYAPRSEKDFVVYPYVAQALEKIVLKGYLIFVVTNQPDIGNGMLSVEALERMHSSLSYLPITKILYCPHSQNEGCFCRKPRPGMLLSLAEEFELNLQNSILVGDRLSDMDAAKAAGCKSIFIERGYTETSMREVNADAICENLEKAVGFM